MPLVLPHRGFKYLDKVYGCCNLRLTSTDVRGTSHLPMRKEKGGSEDGEGKNTIQKNSGKTHTPTP